MREVAVLYFSNSLLWKELQILHHAYPVPQEGMFLQKQPLEYTHHPCKINTYMTLLHLKLNFLTLCPANWYVRGESPISNTYDVKNGLCGQSSHTPQNTATITQWSDDDLQATTEGAWRATYSSANLSTKNFTQSPMDLLGEASI